MGPRQGPLVTERTNTMAVIKMNFLSQALGMQTNVTICLPSYSFKDRMDGREEVYVPGMKYQVMWLLHGGSGDDSDYLHFSNITRYADDNKLAVVMPADYNAQYNDDPNGAKYRTYVMEELPKMCRAIFPFSDKREDNFIAGLSMGGGGVIKIVSDHPENYGAALIMSSSFGWGGAAPVGLKIPAKNLDPTEVREKLLAAREAGKPMPKMFLTVGGNDHATEPMRSHKAWLEENGFDPFWEEVPGYKHEWDFWDLSLRKGINEWLPIRHSVIYPGEE